MRKKRCTQDKREDITVEIDPLWLLSVILTAVMCIFSLFSLVRIVSSFFGASRFEIEGDCPIYSVSDLMAGSDLKKGDKLYKLDLDLHEERLLLNCAYIKDVDIKTSFPNKIKFKVECYKPVWYVEISGDYYALDADLNVLEETKNESRLRQMDLIKLTLPRIKTAIVDDVLTFGDGDEEINETKKIMENIISSPAFAMISGADIDNRYDIHFEFDRIVQKSENSSEESEYIELDGVFAVSIGGYSKLDVKLEYIINALIEEDLLGVSGGSIDVSDIGNKVSIRPVFSSPKEDISDKENEATEETDDPEAA